MHRGYIIDRFITNPAIMRTLLIKDHLCIWCSSIFEHADDKRVQFTIRFGFTTAILLPGPGESHLETNGKIERSVITTS